MTTNDPESASFHSATENGSSSCNGSSTHPYRSLMEDITFPRCHLMATPQNDPGTYARALSTLGHGIALWDAIGSTSRLRMRKHVQTGINIGDVGYLHPGEGEFVYLFNIFSHPSDEIQVECPCDFTPLPRTASENIIKTETYFPPDTILTSKGVSVSRLAASPLDVKFNIYARESGILVLPDGASREDLVVTDALRRFIRANALAWYEYTNRKSESACPNGQLYVITGCDKASNFAAAASCPTGQDSPPYARYQNGKWNDSRHTITTRSYPSDFARTCTVFVRGMQVAISASDWITYIFENQLPAQLPYYEVPSVPVKGFQAKWQTMKENRSKYQLQYVDYPATIHMFNPSAVITKFLIQQYPKAEVAIAEDTMWCVLAHKSDGSIPQIIRILRKILEEHDISEENGLVTLVPRRDELQDASAANPRLFSWAFNIRERYNNQCRRRSIARKLAKIFPSQGIPKEMLST